MTEPGRLGGNSPLVNWLNQLRDLARSTRISSIRGGRFRRGPCGTDITIFPGIKGGKATNPKEANMYRLEPNAIVNQIIRNANSGDFFGVTTGNKINITDINAVTESALRNSLFAFTAAVNPKAQSWFVQRADASLNNAGFSAVCCIAAVPSSNSIAIGGQFARVNDIDSGDTTYNYGLAVVKDDGTADTGFAVGSTLMTGYPPTVIYGPSGKLYVAGRFTWGGATYGFVALNSDGTRYATFAPAAIATLDFWTPSPGNIIYHSGTDLYAAAIYDAGNGAMYDVVKFNTNGTIAANFAVWNVGGTGGFYTSHGAYPQCYALVSSGSNIYILGDFLSYNTTTCDGVILVDTTGALVGTFTPPDIDAPSSGAGNQYIACGAVQSTGKLLIGGRFGGVGGTARDGLARLNTDGTLDTSFSADVAGATKNVTALCIGDNDEIMVGGDFTSIGGVSRTNLAWLSAEGTVLGI